MTSSQKSDVRPGKEPLTRPPSSGTLSPGRGWTASGAFTSRRGTGEGTLRGCRVISLRMYPDHDFDRPLHAPRLLTYCIPIGGMR